MIDSTIQQVGHAAGTRVTAVDAVRGLVIMLLVPDLFGGFSFHAMATRYPEDQVWVTLGSLFSHVEWEGISVWDMIMPVFVLVVGVSLAFSHGQSERPSADGDFRLAKAALRSLALILLGLILFITPQGPIDALVPYVVLSTGLPIERWMQRFIGSDPVTLRRVRLLRVSATLLIAIAWLATNYLRLGNYDLIHIFILIGLAYFPAAALSRHGLHRQWAIAIGILVIYAAAFTLYAASIRPDVPQDLRQLMFAAWTRDLNLGQAFDLWFLNLLPRAEVFAGSAHGYHTLQFVPLISTMLIGRVIGAHILSSRHLPRLGLTLLAGSLSAVAIGYVMSVAMFPLVKSVWTPSWAVLSTGLAGAVLAAFLCVDGTTFGGRWPIRALAPLGTNAALLYTLAAHDRWRIVAGWKRLLGADAFAVAWQPVLASLLVLATLWLLAAILHRWRVFVTL